MGFSIEEKETLIGIVRSSVMRFLKKGLRDDDAFNTSSLSPALKEKKGVFVAIYNSNSLRGCMGTILPVLPIWRACAENARNAAYKDPRFLPLLINELDRISFEIVILEAPRSFSDSEELRGGTYGIILTKGSRKEVYMPDALRILPCTREEFFATLRLKAQIDQDDGEAPESWEMFEAEVISDRNS